ncbi:MAG: hypothetical protein ACP5VQ_05380 [Phycisphaerae bacterium]
MNSPAIIAGDPNSVLRLPKTAMLNPRPWTQSDSDILAHLIQVHSQIQHSRWNKFNISMTHQGDKLIQCSFPDFEDFVFVSVYFRQLTATKDALLKDAVTRYCQFVDSDIKTVWVLGELHEFNSNLDGNAIIMPDYTTRELFDAFIYGAGILHKISAPNEQKKKRFHNIYDKHPRPNVLLALNMSLKFLMNHVGNISVVIYQDYSRWLHDYGLPRPDVRWHDRLFTVAAAHGEQL